MHRAQEATISRSRNYCITLTEGHTDGLANLNNVTETRDPDFATFHYNHKDFQVFIGPVEDADDQCRVSHRHVGIRCLQTSMTKTAASEAMEAYLGLPKGTLHESYCRPLDTNWWTYMAYARKSCYTDRYDQDIKAAADKIRKVGGHINRTNMKRKLVEQHGLTYFNKRLKANLDTFLDTEGQIDPRGQIETPVDCERNARTFHETFKTFQMVVAKSLLRNGCFCQWREEQYAKYFDVRDFQLLVEFLALAPTALRRSTEHVDCLPGLFLFGTRSTGKSTFFVNNVYYKKVPTDAEGVSRYKLDGGQTALLLDDVHPNLFMGGKDGPTLKQVTLGAPTPVKTNGGTGEISAWLVCTSNHPPPFMRDEPPAGTDDQVAKQWKAESGAWKRRFVLLCLGDYIDKDPIIVKWSDYEIRDRAADLLNVILEKIRDRQPNVYRAFLQYYHEVLIKDYPNSCESPKVEYKEVDYDEAKKEMENHDFKNGAPEMMMVNNDRVIGKAEGEAPTVTNVDIPLQELEWPCTHENPISENAWCRYCEDAWRIRCEGLVPPKLLKICENHGKRACPDCFEGNTAQDVIDAVNVFKYQ